MPVANAVHWNVRPSSGSANNGGGFKAGASGTDFSNQDAAQYALTGLASAGSGNTILSAAAANNMVGNIAQAISGTNINVGFYEVVSVSVGVSITFSTNVSSDSLCTGVAASAVINIGGALTKISDAFAQATINNTIYLKGTYSETTALSLTLNNLSGGPFIFEGYVTTPGDGSFVFGSDPSATWTTATNSIDLITFAAVTGYVFRYIKFSSTAGTRGNGISAGITNANGAVAFESCRITGFSKGVVGPDNVQASWDSLVLNNTEIDHCTNYGIFGMESLRFNGCKIHDNGQQGAISGVTYGIYRGVVATFTSFYLNGQAGLESQGHNFFVYGCVFADNTAEGFLGGSTGGGNDGGILIGNVFDTNGTYGVHIAVIPTCINRANCYRGNGTAPRLNLPVGIGDVTLTADPFVDRANGDFTPNSTAGGGLALIAAGYQSDINHA